MSPPIEFVREITFEYGEVDRLSPLIRRVIANNPGPFSYVGTGTYILGTGSVAVIDPGPDDADHIDAILAATAGESISHILVTHTHRDHSPGCALLQPQCDAQTYGFGPHGSGKTALTAHGGEGTDLDFTPDVRVGHGEIIEGGDWSVECVYTPGHTSNHMCFQLREERALFSGDHVMGWSTSVIVPPDGDMHDYMQSLDLLLERDDAIYWPTHGPAVTEPHAHVRAFIEHRLERGRQIVRCIEGGTHRIVDMVPIMYSDVAEELHLAAGQSVFAQVTSMVARGELTTAADVVFDAEYFLA